MPEQLELFDYDAIEAVRMVREIRENQEMLEMLLNPSRQYRYVCKNNSSYHEPFLPLSSTSQPLEPDKYSSRVK